MTSLVLPGFSNQRFLLEPVGYRLWKVFNAVAYNLEDGRSLYVPRDFVTDFASIPQILWFLWPPWRWDYGPAALVHDMGYFMHRELNDTTFTRKEIDDLFLRIMQERNTPEFTANAMYKTVRLVGDSNWNRKK